MSAFIEEHRGRFGVEPICRILDVSASAYYHRATGERSARQIEDERLLERIRELHEANYLCLLYTSFELQTDSYCHCFPLVVVSQACTFARRRQHAPAGRSWRSLIARWGRQGEKLCAVDVRAICELTRCRARAAGRRASGAAPA